MIEQLLGVGIADQHLALAMVVSLFLALMLGYPVAFTLGGVGLIFGLLGPDPEILNVLPLRIYGVMKNITLLAVPLFVFMGVMGLLERSGVAENLLEAMSGLFGRLRSGLAISVIISGALLAASTGIVGASVVTMGLISLPIMLKRGYPAAFSCGVICSSGTLGQIIPPSIVLILLGDIMGISVGELFIAAVVPGLILVAGYSGYSVIYCIINADKLFPPLESQNQSFLKIIKNALIALFPPGLLIVLVLGSIFVGYATPTEAAAVGAFGSIVLAGVYRKLSISILNDVAQMTTRLTSMVFMILVGAQAFGLVFRGLSGDDAIRDFVLSLDCGQGAFLGIVMLLLFILGCFLDFIEIVFIVVPILVPLIEEFDISKIWVAILIAVNLQMSFLTPPFGFSLFYLKGVSPPEIKSGDIYRGVIPFVIIQAAVLALLVLFPEIVEWLPGIVER